MLLDVRPVLAIAPITGKGEEDDEHHNGDRRGISIYSLRHHTVSQTLHVDAEDVLDVQANRRLIIGAVPSLLHAWSAVTLQHLFVCHMAGPSLLTRRLGTPASPQAPYVDAQPGPHVKPEGIYDDSARQGGKYGEDIFQSPPLDMGERWIAFATDSIPSMASAAITTKSSSVPLRKQGSEPSRRDTRMNGFALSHFRSESIRALTSAGRIGQSVVGQTYSALRRARSIKTESDDDKNDSSSHSTDVECCDESCQRSCGAIMIRDVCDRRVIAHFVAHHSDRVGALKFDPSGLLILSASLHGTSIKIFRISSTSTYDAKDSSTASEGSITLLWRLSRGSSSAYVKSIAFSLDSSWVAIATNHGTSHVFHLKNDPSFFLSKLKNSEDSSMASTHLSDFLDPSSIAPCTRIPKQGVSSITARSIHSAASNMLRGTASKPILDEHVSIAVCFCSDSRLAERETIRDPSVSLLVADGDGCMRLQKLTSKNGMNESRNHFGVYGVRKDCHVATNEEACWQIVQQNPSWDHQQLSDAIDYCLGKLDTEASSEESRAKIWAAAVERQTHARSKQSAWTNGDHHQKFQLAPHGRDAGAGGRIVTEQPL